MQFPMLGTASYFTTRLRLQSNVLKALLEPSPFNNSPISTAYLQWLPPVSGAFRVSLKLPQTIGRHAREDSIRPQSCEPKKAETCRHKVSTDHGLQYIPVYHSCQSYHMSRRTGLSRVQSPCTTLQIHFSLCSLRWGLPRLDV